MGVSEVRTQIYLPRAQHKALKRAAEKRSMSMAQLIRQAVDAFLGGSQEPGTPRDDHDDPAWHLLEIADGIGAPATSPEEPPPDARRVDDELYGPAPG